MSLQIKNTYWFLLLSVFFLGIAFYFFSEIVSWVIISFVLAMVGQPLMRFFLYRLKWGRYRWGSPLAALITLLLMVIVFILFFWLFVPVLLEQAQTIANVNYRDIRDALDEPIRRIQAYLAQLGISEQASDPELAIKNAMESWFSPEDIGLFVGSIFTFVTDFLLAIFSISFITFFFLQEKGMLGNFILALVPTQYEDKVKHVLDDSIMLLRRYFGGIFLQITINCIILTIALNLFGIPNAFLIAFFAAVINVVPYLGPLIGAIFGLSITISSSLDLSFYGELLPMLWTVVFIFVGFQMIDNFILQPLIFSTSVMAHPLEIFIVILVAGKIGGIIGMVLAIPVYTMLRVVAANFLSEFKIVQKLTGHIKEVTDEER